MLKAIFFITRLLLFVTCLQLQHSTNILLKFYLSSVLGEENRLYCYSEAIRGYGI
jgi:hypothetical protein